MTASFYSIAKACIWQSKYKTNSTNNNLEKFSYITNNESRIFIQEETNFITNLFKWGSFEFIISFMGKKKYRIRENLVITWPSVVREEPLTFLRIFYERYFEFLWILDTGHFQDWKS